VPFCPTLEALSVDPIGPNSRLGTFTNFVNLGDLVAIAVPAGIGEDGLPVGVTLVTPAWSEGRLAPIADSLHRASAETVGATGRPLPPPDAPDALATGETALFCVGARMSGLALNHQLRDAGGRFLRAARTRPEYRLYALDGRPGLVRGGAGAIEGEIWALPSAAIGPLLARDPPPLGLGTVMLGDEPCLGFLAEADGVSGAADITHLGGWRAWLGAQGRGQGDG
jgi:allophanate hydrolase